jgi:hypothetical protein
MRIGTSDARLSRRGFEGEREEPCDRSHQWRLSLDSTSFVVGYCVWIVFDIGLCLCLYCGHQQQVLSPSWPDSAAATAGIRGTVVAKEGVVC